MGDKIKQNLPIIIMGCITVIAVVIAAVCIFTKKSDAPVSSETTTVASTVASTEVTEISSQEISSSETESTTEVTTVESTEASGRGMSIFGDEQNVENDAETSDQSVEQDTETEVTTEAEENSTSHNTWVNPDADKNNNGILDRFEGSDTAGGM